MHVEGASFAVVESLEVILTLVVLLLFLLLIVSNLSSFLLLRCISVFLFLLWAALQALISSLLIFAMSWAEFDQKNSICKSTTSNITVYIESNYVLKDDDNEVPGGLYTGWIRPVLSFALFSRCILAFLFLRSMALHELSSLASIFASNSGGG